MQVHPANFIYAAICLVLIPISVFGGSYIDYVFYSLWLHIILQLITVCLICAFFGFIISAINVESWDVFSSGGRLR
jgi:hypothetical protein